jgi:DnaK suppressor protein
MKKIDFDQYRQTLLGLRERCTGDVSQLTDEALRKNRQEANGDLSRMPIHMADVGSDNFEQEFTLGLIENQEELMQQIDAALTRIDARTFGQCEECAGEVPLERLRAIPYTPYCVECAKKLEAHA